MLTALQISIFVALISDKGSFSLSGWVEPGKMFEFPFVVSIARRSDITASNPFGHICGGALITRRNVLTAASCFSPGQTEKDYFVYVGSNDLAKATKFEIQSIVTYERWLRKRHLRVDRNPIYTDNDIAIVKMHSSVFKFAHSVKVSILSPEELVGRDVITAGWGLLFTDTPPQHQLKAELRVISRDQCLQNIRNASNVSTYSHEENFFCTNGAILFTVLDEGDKGSPVFLRTEGGDYQIAGVNHVATPWVSDIVQKPDQQNVHVGVHHYIDFLRAVSDLYFYL